MENTFENYIPYGEEWKKEIMKLTKQEIIDMFRSKCIEFEKLNSRIQQIDELLTE